METLECVCMSVCLTLLCLPVRHAAGRHWRGRYEEGGATREDGRQPGRGRQVGRGETCLKNTTQTLVRSVDVPRRPFGI